MNEPSAVAHNLNSNRKPWGFAILFLASALAISVGGRIYFVDQRDHIKQEQQQHLAVIADLKVAQISQWQHERMADANSIAQNPFLLESISEMHTVQNARRVDVKLVQWLHSFCQDNGYVRLALLDSKGKVLVTDGTQEHLGLHDKALLDSAVASQKALFSDFYRETEGEHLYCDIIVPCFSAETHQRKVLGAVLLRIDVSEFFFPLVQSWPSASRTSEVLLVEKDGNQVLYLNELRHVHNFPLGLRIPANNMRLLGAMAVADSQGLAEGIDYRGVAVLGALRKIPNSPWRLIAKVDQDEVYAPIRERSETVIVFVVIVIVAVGASIGLLWRHQRSVQYRRTLELELRRRTIEERVERRFRSLIENANDLIIVTNPDGFIVFVSPSVQRELGYSMDDLAKRTFDEFVHPDDLAGLVELRRDAIGDPGKVLAFDHRMRHNNGSWLNLESHFKYIALSGESGEIIINARDTEEHRKALEAIRLSEEKFSKAFLTSPDAISINKLKDGTFVEINDGFALLTGYSKEEVIGRTSLDINIWVTPQDQRRFVKELVRRGEVSDFEAEFATKGGSKRTGLISGKIMNVQNEQWILSITRDITERKRSEQFLVENEERMRVALQGANITVFNQDVSLRYTWMYNPQLGNSSNTFVGKTDSEVLPSSEVEKIVELKRKVLSTGKGAHSEFSMNSQGELSHYELAVEPLRNEKGLIVGITGASLDITNRKRAEEQLGLQRVYFQQLFESAPEAIVLLKPNEQIVQVNREFTRLFGYTQEDAVGQQINALIVPAKFMEEGSTLSRRVAQGLIVSTESIRQRKDGSLVDVSILGRPVKVDGGQIALYAIYRDITDRKIAEEALRKSESSFRGLFNSVSDAIYILDRESHFVDVNQGSVTMYGYPREYFVGKTPSDFSAPGRNDLAGIAQLVAKAFEGETQQFEFWGIRKNAEVFPKEIRLSKGTYFGQEVVIALAQDITARKRFELALQETNRTLESLINASPLAITVMDEQCTIQLWNPAAQRIFGWKADEVIGKFNPIIPEENRDEFIELHKRTLRGEPIPEFEARRKKKDGAIIDISRSTAVVRDSNGKATGIMAVLADITERKRAEEQLRESEERLRVALTGANMMSWELDLLNGSVSWSDSAEGFFGLGRSEFKGTRDAFIALIHPDDRLNVEQAMDDSIRAAKEFKAEFRIIWPDGSVHWHGAFGRALCDEKGRVQKVSGIGVDITERKRTEETIQKLLHAVEQTDEVIIMTEPDGIITYVNPAFEKLYRYSSEEVIGKTPRVVKSGGMSQEYYSQFWRDLLAGKSIRAEHINKTKDGKIVIVEASVNSVYDTKGKLAGFIAVQEDISDRKRNEAERKRLEAQLLQTQKLESIGTLAGGIAHDFNNILGIILAYSSSLRNSHLPYPKVENAADVINKAVGRGADLVKQILTFARKTDVVYELVDINVMIIELKKMLSETLPRTIAIATELAADVSEITADAAQVHQAILNICLNAKDAMPAGGKLSLRTQIGTRSEVSSYFPEATGERYLRVSISDTGAGMDESTRQRIFEPFFTTKVKGKGTGLGLSVVYGVVKNHNGFVRVTSEIGKGTTFHLYFPAHVQYPRPIEKVQRSLVDIPGGSESILVVEDEEPMLNVLSGLLKSKGYKVYVARDGYEAVATYEQHYKEISVVVSDLGLPKMTGQDAFLRMKSVNPRIKVIFGTGYLDPELKTELLSMGAKGFLSKPYSQDELLRRIRDLIDLST